MPQNLQRLIQEQYELQIIDGTNRCRTIDQYSDIFGLCDDCNIPEEKRRLGLKRLIQDIIHKNGKAVWVDLGCGNGIAQRQAKIYLENEGLNPNQLITYGYDVLPQDENKILWYIANWPREYSRQILDKKFKQEFFQEDISQAVFPKKADIITCAEVLMWIDDPLQVFSNAAKQANLDAVLCFNRLDFIYYYADPRRLPEATLFDNLFLKHKCIPGFRMINKYDDYMILKKTIEMADYTYGYKLFGKHRIMQGFSHSYLNTSSA